MSTFSPLTFGVDSKELADTQVTTTPYYYPFATVTERKITTKNNIHITSWELTYFSNLPVLLGYNESAQHDFPILDTSTSEAGTWMSKWIYEWTHPEPGVKAQTISGAIPFHLKEINQYNNNQYGLDTVVAEAFLPNKHVYIEGGPSWLESHEVFIRVVKTPDAGTGTESLAKNRAEVLTLLKTLTPLKQID